MDLLAYGSGASPPRATHTKISLYFPAQTGEIGGGDEFADDCLHRQLAYRLCTTILLS